MNLKSHPEYHLRQLPREEFFQLVTPQIKRVFGESFRFDVRSILSERERENAKRLQESMGEPYRLNVALFRGDEFVGWSFGWQTDSESYYMTNSAVLPEYQGRGLYTAMLNKIIEILVDKGFQIIFSRHSATNNAILVPKLKAGFIIGAMDISDGFGLLIHLRYYTNPLRRRMMDVRSGETKPDAELRKILGLDTA